MATPQSPYQAYEPKKPGFWGKVSGFFTGGNLTKEQRELMGVAKAKLYGPIDPVAAQALQTAIGRRYEQIRRQQGADIARRGLFQSTIGSNVIGRTYDVEREALAQALAQQQAQQEMIGINLYGQISAAQVAQMQARAKLWGDIASSAAQLFTSRSGISSGTSSGALYGPGF